jgi:8-oxo-dGTP diphosphatase
LAYCAKHVSRLQKTAGEAERVTKTPCNGGLGMIMQGLNVIWMFNSTTDKVLMCKRHKEPYKGLYNLVGGKIEAGEDGFAAAYRELREETSITSVELIHLMDCTYFLSQIRLEVYVGKLKKDVVVFGDEKELLWIDANENFFDMTRFAGEGNIGHIYETIKYNRLFAKG